MKDKIQVSAQIPKDVHRKARIKSVKTGKPLAEVIREALEDWAKSGDPPEED